MSCNHSAGIIKGFFLKSLKKENLISWDSPFKETTLSLSVYHQYPTGCNWGWCNYQLRLKPYVRICYCCDVQYVAIGGHKYSRRYVGSVDKGFFQIYGQPWMFVCQRGKCLLILQSNEKKCGLVIHILTSEMEGISPPPPPPPVKFTK